MRSFQSFLWGLYLVVAVGLGLWALSSGSALAIAVAVVFLVAGALAVSSVRVANQWQRGIVLRLGRFKAVRGPGLFFIIPVVETVAYVIDIRTITSPFRAEKTLTLDTVPVDVDAVLFWKVVDPERAALAVERYEVAVNWTSQTALRDVIGRSTLAQILSDRRAIDDQMRSIIDSHTEPWGIRVESVEIRDVRIPGELQGAMSRQAQAERERQARVILALSEVQIAEKFGDAASVYASNPTALHLRAMNMLYEGLKERGALMIVPSSALDSMSLGAMTGLASLGHQAEGVPSIPGSPVGH
ncbi:MAG TPA: slipin family protein [Myxococcaceae bacterium]|jgi:regulator of protease activity HflC (stomatin/prohibitin superfamily)